MNHTLWQSVVKVAAAYKKTIIGLILIVIIAMPNIIAELAIELAELIFEFLELVYESISFALEELIQHIFHIDKGPTQTIVFYIWLAAIGFAGYRLWRLLPHYWQRLKDQLHQTWWQWSKAFVDYWQALTLFKKIRLIVIYLTGFYLIFTVFI